MTCAFVSSLCGKHPVPLVWQTLMMPQGTAEALQCLVPPLLSATTAGTSSCELRWTLKHLPCPCSVLTTTFATTTLAHLATMPAGDPEPLHAGGGRPRSEGNWPITPSLHACGGDLEDRMMDPKVIFPTFPASLSLMSGIAS